MAGSTLHNVVQQYLCLDNSDKIDMFKIKSSINTLTNKHTVINLIGFNNAERYSLGMNLRDYINYIENGGNIVKDYKYKDLTQEQLLSYAYSSEFHNKLLRFNSKTTNKYKYLNEVLNMLLELQRYRENIYLYRIDRDVVSIIVYDRGKIQDDLKELSKFIDKSLKGIYSKVLISNIREIENGSIYNYYRINAIDVDKIKNIDNREYNTILDICGSIKYSGKWGRNVIKSKYNIYLTVLIQIALITTYGILLGKEMALEYIHYNTTNIMVLNISLIVPINYIIARISGYKRNKFISIPIILGILLTLAFELYIGYILIKINNI